MTYPANGEARASITLTDVKTGRKIFLARPNGAAVLKRVELVKK